MRVKYVTYSFYALRAKDVAWAEITSSTDAVDAVHTSWILNKLS
jgi:hypothetical protein